LVEYWKFDIIYIGVYSTRPGTYAQKHLQDNVPYDIKQKRRDRLNNLLNKTSKENNEKVVWNTRKVLINSFSWTNKDWIFLYEWYTDNNKQIIISSKSQLTPWDFINAKITSGVVFKLFGEYSN
jgi:tRNA-2-methylthio-N6-dimethylallyladenosine synthase